jgi:hypothetical protein
MPILLHHLFNHKCLLARQHNAVRILTNSIKAYPLLPVTHKHIHSHQPVVEAWHDLNSASQSQLVCQWMPRWDQASKQHQCFALFKITSITFVSLIKVCEQPSSSHLFLFILDSLCFLESDLKVSYWAFNLL